MATLGLTVVVSTDVAITSDDVDIEELTRLKWPQLRLASK